MDRAITSYNSPLTKIDRFEVLEEIGRGASAVVYRALDSSLGRPVALKVMQCAQYTSPVQAAEFSARFRREAAAAVKLNHPNIVSVYEFGEVETIRYIAMELLEGQTLRDRINSGMPLSAWEALPILDDISAALDHAHKSGIVHRDIKPDNIFLVGEGRAKLTDFGIARRTDQLCFTQAGSYAGTPAYMSPEQLAGEVADERSDIFSLGVTVYEGLAGWRPFGGESIPKVVHNITNSQPQEMAGTPQVLERVILRALTKDPARRYQSAREFFDAFRLAVTDPVPSAVAPPVSGESRPESTSPQFRSAPARSESGSLAQSPPVTRAWHTLKKMLRQLAAVASLVFVAFALGAAAGALSQGILDNATLVTTAPKSWTVPSSMGSQKSAKPSPSNRSSQRRADTSGGAKVVWQPAPAHSAWILLGLHAAGLAGVAVLAGWILQRVRRSRFRSSLAAAPVLLGMSAIFAAAAFLEGSSVGWQFASIDRRVGDYNELLRRAQEAPVGRMADQALVQFELLRKDPRAFRDYRLGQLCVPPATIPKTQLALGAGRLLVKRNP
jgi:serine/threonine-protein kinase